MKFWRKGEEKWRKVEEKWRKGEKSDKKKQKSGGQWEECIRKQIGRSREANEGRGEGGVEERSRKWRKGVKSGGKKWKRRKVKENHRKGVEESTEM